MSLSNVHSDLNDIVAFDREEQRESTGWDIPDYSNDRVKAPADRAAFLDRFDKRYITKDHWHNLTMMKDMMLDCMTLAISCAACSQACVSTRAGDVVRAVVLEPPCYVVQFAATPRPFRLRTISKCAVSNI